MYHQQAALSPNSVGLRRHASSSVVPSPSMIAYPTDEVAGRPSQHTASAQYDQQRHQSATAEMPTKYFNNNGNGDPWTGAFTKTFMNDGELASKTNRSDGGMALARPYPVISKLVAEFVGTLLLVFVGSLCGIHPNNQKMDNAPFFVLQSALAHGLTIFAAVSSLGHVSGAHFNPAVTLGIALSGKMNALLVVFYWLAQLAGGFCAALLVKVVTSREQYQAIVGGATIVPSNTQFWFQALIVEVLLTAFLVQTILTCAVDSSPQHSLASLAIGMAITAGILGGASISGASLNPARSLGPCLVASLFLGKGQFGTSWSDPMWSLHFIYWAGPFIGAAIAALLYRTFFGRNGNRLLP